MKITDIRVRTCSIPIEAPTRHSYASPSFYTCTIVELFTNEMRNGEPIIGLGETYGTIGAEAFEPLNPFLIGADPFDLQRLLIQIRQRGCITRQPMLAAPIEFACLDLQGKAIERPAYEILGGKVRDEVEVAAYVFFRYANPQGDVPTVTGPEDVVAFTQQLVARHDFRTIKLKGGVFEPQHEVPACKPCVRLSHCRRTSCATIPTPYSRPRLPSR